VNDLLNACYKNLPETGVVILGDFNVKLLKKSSNKKLKKYFSTTKTVNSNYFSVHNRLPFPP